MKFMDVMMMNHA